MTQFSKLSFISGTYFDQSFSRELKNNQQAKVALSVNSSRKTEIKLTLYNAKRWSGFSAYGQAEFIDSKGAPIYRASMGGDLRGRRLGKIRVDDFSHFFDLPEDIQARTKYIQLEVDFITPANLAYRGSPQNHVIE